MVVKTTGNSGNIHSLSDYQTDQERVLNRTLERINDSWRKTDAHLGSIDQNLSSIRGREVIQKTAGDFGKEEKSYLQKAVEISYNILVSMKFIATFGMKVVNLWNKKTAREKN